MQNPCRRILQSFKSKHAYSTKQFLDVGQPSASTHPHLMKEGELTPGITREEYISRRKKLLELLPEKSLAILASSPVKMMTDVVPYTFRQDADYLYITGCQQPGGIAVLGHDCGLCMFMREADPHDVTWQGQVAGVNEAFDTFKAEQAFPIRILEKILPAMIRKSSKLFHNIRTAISAYTGLDDFQNAVHSGKVNDLSAFTHKLRLTKSPAEIKLMRDSASIACQGLLQTMLHSRAFPHEGQLSAKIEYECRIRGAERMAFNPVVASGQNASVIHYSRNDQKEELYTLILETNKECLKLCKPGASISEIHNHSVELLREGFKSIGILRGVGNKRYHQLNPTNIGHYLGMDVHDCSAVGYDCPLKPGVVITIEPGVYIPSLWDCPKWYRGIGIRIEDEVLITETGCEVLTASSPKEIGQMESLLNNHRHGREGAASRS